MSNSSEGLRSPIVSPVETPETQTPIEHRETLRHRDTNIQLDFFRHGEKESTKGIPDELVKLTKVGRQQAIGRSDSADISQSVAFASPRVRTQETAGLVMGGQQVEITGEENLDELREKLNTGLSMGTKLGVDKRLDFNLDLTADFGQRALAAVKKGAYLKFLVEESDTLGASLPVDGVETYNRMASRVAEIIKKYLSIAPKWDALVNDPKNKNYSDTLKRFFGSHQGILESFLAKVIEQTKGLPERDAFVAALGNQGFDYVEGFKADIVSRQGKNQEIHLSYKKEKDGVEIYSYDMIVPEAIIDQIILPRP